MKIIELSRLTEACVEEMAIVRAEWPDGIPVTQASLDRAIELELDLRWAAERLLSKTALVEYYRACGQAAERVCRRVCGSSLAEYVRACGQALLSALLAESEKVFLRLYFTTNNAYDSVLLAEEKTGLVHSAWGVDTEIARNYIDFGCNPGDWDDQGLHYGKEAFRIVDYGEVVGENGSLPDDVRQKWFRDEEF